MNIGDFDWVIMGMDISDVNCFGSVELGDVDWSIGGMAISGIKC